MKRNFKEGSVNCWRCTSSERQQAVLSIKNLEYGLQKLRKEGWNQRKVLRSRVGDSKYWRIVRDIRIRSVKVRSKENRRLRRKEANIKKRFLNCEKHQLCRWIKRYERKLSKEKDEKIDCCLEDSDPNDTELVRVD